MNSQSRLEGKPRVLGKVSDADRAAMRRQGRAHFAASRYERPPGSLRAALEAMRQIERELGMPPWHEDEPWSDFDSHMAYLSAVRKKSLQAKSAPSPK